LCVHIKCQTVVAVVGLTIWIILRDKSKYNTSFWIKGYKTDGHNKWFDDGARFVICCSARWPQLPYHRNTRHARRSLTKQSRRVIILSYHLYITIILLMFLGRDAVSNIIRIQDSSSRLDNNLHNIILYRYNVTFL